MADYLLILEKGKQIVFEEKEALMSKYRMVKGSKHQLDCMKSRLIGRLDRETYSEALVKTEDGPFPFADTVEAPTIEDLLCYLYGQKKSVTEHAKLQSSVGA
jgi:ABC-type multidrug transport system ATPase subunit